MEDLFNNISQIINVLAPNFQNSEPSLENLLKLICRIKQSLEDNSIHFGNKTLILFYYFLATNEQIKFEIQFNRIVIYNEEKFTVEAFESKSLTFRFMSFLCATTIDLQGIILKNWLDRPLTVEKGELLCTFEFGNSSEIIL